MTSFDNQTMVDIENFINNCDLVDFGKFPDCNFTNELDEDSTEDTDVLNWFASFGTLQSYQNYQHFSEDSAVESDLSCSSTTSDASHKKSLKLERRGQKLHSKRQRCGRIWEFIRNLLFDTKTCPCLIKWENHIEGTFKFVQTEKVAKLWGERAHNPRMNFEKFSRAIRYHYKNKKLLPVYGKRLVYKFGPAAIGWKTTDPILG
ncbi:hypothetical protein FQA39_LY02160 [Lamprigera yunnana]|nr:hypothetical protein FQA39_LY02160 [Lamprigera yunnana]